MGDEIIKVLDELCRRFGIVIDWTSENVLPYLQQLCEKFISWEISTSFAWIAIAGIFTGLFLIFTIIANVNDWDDGFLWFAFMFILFVSIIVIGKQVFDIIECKTFPEKAIYDYIKYHTSN